MTNFRVKITDSKDRVVETVLSDEEYGDAQNIMDILADSSLNGIIVLDGTPGVLVRGAEIVEVFEEEA